MAAFALDDDPDAGPAVFVHVLAAFLVRQPADFEDQGRARIIVVDDHGVVGLAVVHIAEPAAHCQNPRRELGHSQEPPGDVHLVDALVAEVAIAGVPHPVPVVVEPFAHQGQLQRRAAPQVIVDLRRDRLRAIDLADGVPPLVAEAARDLDLAQVAGANPLDSSRDAGPGRSALGASLDNPIVFAGGFDRLAPLPDIVGDGLLDVDVLACLAGPHDVQRMPVVGRRARDHVDLAVFQQLAVIGVGLDRDALARKALHRRPQDLLVAIAQTHQAHARHLAESANVRPAPPAEPDHRHAKIAVGASRRRP